MRTRFDVFVGISSEKLTWLFLLKNVKNSPDGKMIKLKTFDFLLPTWNDEFLSWLENGNGKAINLSISLWTRTLSPLFSYNLTFLLSSKWVTWYKGEKVSQDPIFQQRFHWRRRCQILRTLMSLVSYLWNFNCGHGVHMKAEYFRPSETNHKTLMCRRRNSLLFARVSW